MTNARFKSDHLEMDAATSDLIEEAVSAMLAAYDDAGARIFARLARARRTVGFVTAKAQDVLMREVADELTRFRKSGGEIFRDALSSIAKIGADSAHLHLSRFTSDGSGPYDEAVALHAKKALSDADEYFVLQIERMRATIRQLLREDAAKVFRRAAMDDITRRAAFELLKAEIQTRDPEYKFVDRAGRQWDSKVYFEMLTKTVLANLQREIYIDQLTSEGHDLVIVSHVGSKDACRFWEHKVLSLTGATPGYPTLDYAASTKQVFHPRCRHRLIAYHPEVASALGIEIK
jgi:hypothetical protein